MKIIDFTLTYEEGMRGVAFENAKSKSIDGWNSKHFICIPMQVRIWMRLFILRSTTRP